MIEYDNQGRMKYNSELHFNQGQRWSEEEINYLVNWYHITGVEEMSLALGRSEQTIFEKVCKLRKKGLMSKEKSSYNLRLLRLDDRETIIA
ncbi:MAG: hypothetical protein HUJ77_14955 [Clostridium sp.]|uniref:hypothetical protein n=1 Tax=Clostridium sp. TaxID=1506 RepID=UPI0025C6CFE2|nr:hypothetical protein [Clostridium sp.]MCF0149682.1 hypothetical protein [Clostridium sp.]